MRVTVNEWGNSLALRISCRLAADAQWREETVLDLPLENGRLIAEPVEDLTLEALLTRVIGQNLHGDVFDACPVGCELLGIR